MMVSCNTNRVERRCVVEMIAVDLDSEAVQAIAASSGAKDTRVYRWEDHLVIYSHFEDVGKFTQRLSAKFPKMEVRVYDAPYYAFKITEHREGYTLAKEWDHVVLTANLVDDEQKQQEYMEYHRTQFEKWPEIAQGFSRADFQELNCYRYGRQLMLVISIPSGAKFEDLDPKTLENNPRGVEWNTIMGRYQEGIEGTKPGETWVFLNEVK